LNALKFLIPSPPSKIGEQTFVLANQIILKFIAYPTP